MHLIPKFDLGACRGVYNTIFFSEGGGGKVTFLDFSRRDFSLFPLEMSILVDPV